MFGFGKTKKQILALSQVFAKLSGFAQQNRSYISQIEKENEYFRTLFKQLGIPVKSRSEWLINQAEKEQNELNELVRNKVADELARNQKSK